MAYSLVPDSANTVGSDLTAMYDNFVALESSQIVDKGSTADGDYWRFEDGLQICIFEKDSITADGSAIYFFEYFDYPVNFISRPVLALKGYCRSGGVDIRRLVQTSDNSEADPSSQCRPIVMPNNPNEIEKIGFSYIAIGKWK